MTPFREVASAQMLGEGLFEAHTPLGWAQGRAVFGGVLAAQALDALSRSLPEPRPLRGVTISFIAPTAPGASQGQVQILRHGRAMTQAEVRLSQEGQLRLVLMAAYGPARPSVLEVQGPSSPPSVPLEELISMPYLPGITPEFTQHYEYRWSEGGFPFSGSDRSDFAGWVRPRDGLPVDEGGVMALLDAWPAPTLALASLPVPASTVTWMVNFAQAMPPGGWPGGAWMRFRSETLRAGQGHLDISSRLWTAEGELLASSHQLVVEFSGR